MNKSSPKHRRFDLQHFGDNYRVETKNLFEELLVAEEETTPDELWLDIKDSILRTATKHVPKKGEVVAGRDKSELINQLCQELEDQSSHNNSRELFRCVKNLKTLPPKQLPDWLSSRMSLERF